MKNSTATKFRNALIHTIRPILFSTSREPTFTSPSSRFRGFHARGITAIAHFPCTSRDNNPRLPPLPSIRGGSPVLARVTGLAAELGVGVPLPRRFLPASRLSRVRSRDPRTWQREVISTSMSRVPPREPLSGQAPWNGASCHTDSPHRVSSLMRNYREFLLCNQSFNAMIGYTWIHFFSLSFSSLSLPFSTSSWREFWLV